MFRARVFIFLFTLVMSMPSAFGDGLPQSLLQLPDSVATVFFAEANSSTLHRLSRTEEGLQVTGTYYMSVGQAGLGKQVSGDRKTPLGVYLVTEELDTSRLHEKYGARAFPLDYPNAWDLRHGRDGDGIWVHGVDRRGGKRPPLDTDGCIALPNDDIVALSGEFLAHTTPVVVVRDIKWSQTTAADVRDDLVNGIREWLNSQRDGNLHQFLTLYDDAFTRWGVSKEAWNAIQIERFAAMHELQLQSDEDEWLLLAYPEEEGLFFSRFPLRTTDKGVTHSGMKRLYWQRGADGVLRVVAERDG